MFEDDEFFLDDEGMSEDIQLSIVDDAKVKLLETLDEIIKEMKYNVKLKEDTSFTANISLLSKKIDILISLMEIDNLSEEEQKELIENAFKQSTELTFQNINDFVSPDESEKDCDASTTEDQDDDGSLDF